MSRTARPNVLIIHADQHRYDCLGAYGNSDIRTPNLDKLATDSVRYENSFCPYPVCTPSRYSLLTGLYVHQHMGGSNHATIPSGRLTFPKIMRETDYKTTAVGKMHLAPTYLDVGFNKMVLAEQAGPGRYDDDYHRYLHGKDLVDSWDLIDQVKEYRDNAPNEYWDSFGAKESNLGEEDHSTTWIAEQALGELAEWSAEGGCLLMVGFIKPHHPFDPPSPWSKMYDPKQLSLLPGWTNNVLEHDEEKHKGYFPCANLNEKRLRLIMSLYYASISQIDYQVGRIINFLIDKGLYDDTLIIYTSDHGEYMGFHHRVLKGNYLYDPLAKVPLLIKYPGGHRAGEVSKGLVSNVDVAPTILKQVGCVPSPLMKGLDLAEDKAGRLAVFAQSGRQYMARTHEFKLILNKGAAPSLLFDLKTDPLEMTNLYEHPLYRDVRMEMTDRILNWMLFDAPAPVHLDTQATTVFRPDLAKGCVRASELQAYFAQAMNRRKDA